MTAEYDLRSRHHSSLVHNLFGGERDQATGVDYPQYKIEVKECFQPKDVKFYLDVKDVEGDAEFLLFLCHATQELWVVKKHHFNGLDHNTTFRRKAISKMACFYCQIKNRKQFEAFLDSI
jgi:hypothetical protein